MFAVWSLEFVPWTCSSLAAAVGMTAPDQVSLPRMLAARLLKGEINLHHEGFGFTINIIVFATTSFIIVVIMAPSSPSSESLP